ncbi:hypothetical protein BDZ94DRAFT_1179897, partial [Collybia nuda]
MFSKTSNVTPNQKEFLFLESHPQYKTHYTIYNMRNKNLHVPNFVGGALPRCDQGDREYYSCTMLTLFKPWRTGEELKSNSETWDIAFKLHVFSNDELKLMRNFNLKYECNDARDDYYSILKKKKKDAKMNNTSSNVLLNNNDDYINDMDIDHHDYGDDNFMTVDIDVFGEKTLRMLSKMRDAERIMNGAGWLDDCTDKPPVFDTSIFIPDTILTPNQWKAVVRD